MNARTLPQDSPESRTLAFDTMRAVHAAYAQPLIRQLDSSHSPRISNDDQQARRAEAARLTALLETHAAFSFVRLGDMELTLLLAQQDGALPERWAPSKEVVNGTQPAGGPGVHTKQVGRLRCAYEQADYVDFHEALPLVASLLPQLRLERAASLDRNPSPQTSYILPQWVQHEFRAYCSQPGRRFGIAGAEASLLEWLARRDEFRGAAAAVWPADAEVAFHQVRNNGRRLGDDLDVIKEDLRQFVTHHRLDTLMLSLGGGAKILCYELAREMEIRAIDFGAMTRSLCDLGSDGHLAGRSSHSISFYRLPFELVMDGIEATQPELQPEELLAKAHAQLIHQLTDGPAGVSVASSQRQWTDPSRARFRAALGVYRRRYAALEKRSAATQSASRRFLHFCGRHGLTFQGRVFHGWFRVKHRLATALGFAQTGKRR